jgi:hypothetical protein
VRLVGVAGLRRESGQVVTSLPGRQAGVDPRDEPAEPEHPLQGLGTVADDRMAAAAQLPYAQPDLRCDVFGPHPGVGQQDRGPGRGRIGVTVLDQGGGQFQRADRGGIRVQRARQPPRVAMSEIFQVHALVTEFAQRKAERGAAGRRPEPDADDDRAGLHHGADRTGVRAGHVCALALFPDQVAARVGQHQAVPVASGVRNDLRPQARDGVTQPGRGRPLQVAGRQVPHADRLGSHAASMPRRWPFRSIREPWAVL